MSHPVLATDAVAVITGGASGIGLAAAKSFAGRGMKTVLADLGADRLDKAAAEVAAISPHREAGVMACETDVSRSEDLQRLEKGVRERFGAVDVLMNNAGIGLSTSTLDNAENWRRMFDVNLFGVLNGIQAFVPGMVESGRPGIVINTGSKQGITTPPGNPGYNATKAAVKVLTEQLAHELREAGAPISAHLFVPGFTYTGMIAAHIPEKPAAAWTSEQAVDYMIEHVEAGDFYILCPDNDVTPELDRLRVAWAIGDVAENRPALSRWHPDYADAFKAFIAKGTEG